MTDLVAWYRAECNGDWEHSYGIQIETLDNPGWMVTIDLTETAWEGLSVPRVTSRTSESVWHQHEVADNKFIGTGGIDNLGKIIDAFFEAIGSRRSST